MKELIASLQSLAKHAPDSPPPEFPPDDPQYPWHPDNVASHVLGLLLSGAEPSSQG